MGEVIHPEMVSIAGGLRVLIVEDEAHRPDENKESSYLFEIELQSEASNENFGRHITVPFGRLTKKGALKLAPAAVKYALKRQK
ncbi:MAG: hypothetical protein ACHQ0Y_02905 [Thermodesulfovibrionales bacterium]